MEGPGYDNNLLSPFKSEMQNSLWPRKLILPFPKKKQLCVFI